MTPEEIKDNFRFICKMAKDNDPYVELPASESLAIIQFRERKAFEAGTTVHMPGCASRIEKFDDYLKSEEYND